MTKLKVTSPYDNSLIEEVELNTSDEVEAVIDRAYKIFKNRDSWLPKYKRIEILENLVSLMQESKEELINVACREGGKPYNDTVVEVDRAIAGVKIGISAVGELAGKQIPMGLTPPSVGRTAFTDPEPIGVVASLSAFNHPVNLIVHQVIPAIIAGCPVIVKPASATPLSCLKMVDLIHRAGAPEGYVTALVCDRDSATKLATDPRVNFLSFIGSASVGWGLKSKLSPGTRCALEHGGVAPVIIDESANLDQVLPGITKGGFYHAGQVCVSVQRVYLTGGRAGEFAEMLSDAAKKLVVGDPLDAKTEVGPLITPKEVDRVESWVNEAREQGAEILCGGKRISDSCYEPTVILNPPKDSKVASSEIFGPVVCVFDAESIDQAIEFCNDSPFAFQASVFSKEIDNAIYCTQRINAAAVMINDHTAFRVDWMPFGGRDHSGQGVGGISQSAHEMSRDKLYVIKSS